MKHSISTTVFLLLLFLSAQIIGLLVLSHYIKVEEKDGVFIVEYEEVPFIGAPPEVNQNLSFIPIMIAVLVGTGIILLIIKFGKPFIFRYWIAGVVFLALTIALSALITLASLLPFFPYALSSYAAFVIAVVLSLILTYFKLFRTNAIAHNLSEVLVYGGIAVVFVPLLNLFSVSILLVLISLYDAFAVWKSKHMITLAKFQADAKAFSGLMLSYKKQPVVNEKTKAKKGQKLEKAKREMIKTAILGGGDIAFPLMFAGVVMKSFGLEKAFIIPLFVAAALAILLFKGSEDKFYPAMPFLSAGCFAGLVAVIAL